MRIGTLSALFGLLAGCSQPVTLQYDHGRAYAEAFGRQADLARPSAAADQYPLGGEEGLALRNLVKEATSEKKDATPETTEEIQ